MRRQSAFAYDASYVHDEARISADLNTAMLFHYGGFCIVDRYGVVLAEVSLPDQDKIYDQQFRKDGNDSWLEVIWYDGTVRLYDAGDGSLRSEEKREPPSKDLYEEFYTDQYRIASSLHSAPVVYDRETGKKVTELETESYLTYVTQLGELLVTEYVNTEESGTAFFWMKILRRWHTFRVYATRRTGSWYSITETGICGSAACIPSRSLWPLERHI